MKQCVKCGSAQPDEGFFCGNCGASFAPVREMPRDTSDDFPQSAADGGASAAAHQSDMPTLGLPTRIPRALKPSESALVRLAARVGFPLGIAVPMVAQIPLLRDTMLGSIFRFRDLSVVIPISISCLFFWGGAICFLRWRRLRELRELSQRKYVLAASDFVSRGELEALLQQLSSPVTEVSPPLRRIRTVVRHWFERSDLQDVEFVLQECTAHDEELVHQGYNLVRTFIWALPVLGLIGTVIGISLAVGGFAQFLSGDVDDVQKIKQSLVGVTGGLSFAFLITLAGLLGSLLLMFAAAALQAREGRLYSEAEYDIVELLVPALQGIKPAPGASPADLSFLRDAIGKFVTKALNTLQEHAAALIRRMDDRGGRHQTAIDDLTRQIAHRIESAARDLATSTARVTTSVSEELSVIVRNAETLRAMCAAQAELQSAVKELADADLAKSLSTLASSVAATSVELRCTRDTVAQLAETTHAVLASRATLEGSMRQLEELQLKATFAGLRDTLATLQPILDRLTKPFVLQAVPAQPHGELRGADGSPAATSAVR